MCELIRIHAGALGSGRTRTGTVRRPAYSPIHSKYCIIDNHLVLEGSFNWYNASVFSHDIVILAANSQVAEPYLFEFEQIHRRLRIFW